MFFRLKKSGSREYLQLVENRWEDGRSKQRVLITLGRADHLRESGELDALLASGSRFSEKLLILSEYKKGTLPTLSSQSLGPARIFDRLWQQIGCHKVLQQLLAERKFEFAVERVIFLEVLHRLVDPGSDRACYHWKDDHAVDGAEDLQLHHAYRAMAWLGEPIDEETESVLDERKPASHLRFRCTKDRIEEALFDRRRDLFSSLGLVFFDTTSIYFEGEGGQELGERGFSKDKRPDLKQMIVGAVIDDQGAPICCEMWPGNTADVTTLLPVVEKLKKRFGIENVCIVADRGMIKAATLEALEKLGLFYILGTRMRSQNEVRNEVLSRAGRYKIVHDESARDKAPSPLEVKEVLVEGRRYVVCRNAEQARKDAHDRKAILAALEDRLSQGSVKSMVANRGYRKYLRTVDKGTLAIDPNKVEREERFDGKWVLRTNTDLSTAEIALRYKQLWTVEHMFRSVKSLLSTRPIYHKCDETIRGHVFCSFLALTLRHELQQRLEAKGMGNVEWAAMIRDLSRVRRVDVEAGDKRFRLRTETPGVAGKVFQACGVALPHPVEQMK
jgi:transposase